MATPPTFSVGQTLTAAHMNAVGLWLVKSQAVGSGVSSVTVTDAFSADYDNYRITYSGGTASGSNLAYQLQFANVASSHYAAMRYDGWPALSGTLTTSGQNFAYFGLSSSATAQMLVFDVFDPFKTAYTKFTGSYVSDDYQGTGGGVFARTTSLTSFTLIAPAFTMTGGTIRVYGYRN